MEADSQKYVLSLSDFLCRQVEILSTEDPKTLTAAIVLVDKQGYLYEMSDVFWQTTTMIQKSFYVMPSCAVVDMFLILAFSKFFIKPKIRVSNFYFF